MSAEKQENGENISWHPAFFEAIQRELAQYEEVFQFISEFQLTTEPLRIDLVIIKKLKDIPITKNIATIFRTDNLVEYKSPTDYLSVADFYKVYGYACLYTFLKAEQSSTKPSIPAEYAEPQKLAQATKLTARTVSALKELSLTFVVSHHPRELLTHLQQVRGYTVDGSIPGIYIVQGDIFPIQLIDNRELSDDENIWLRSLDDRLDVARMTRLTQEIERLGKAARLSAYVDVIARANVETLREAIKMRRSSVTLDQVLVETAWRPNGRLEGDWKGRLKADWKGSWK